MAKPKTKPKTSVKQKKVIITDFEEIFERVLKGIGSSCHVVVPKRHKGKMATVIVGGEEVKG